MSASQPIIEHPGMVLKVLDDSVEVMILSQSACASCHAKGACTAADMEEKIVSISKSQPHSYKVGQQVTVFMQQKMGTLAVLFGYVFPFVFMLITLIVLLINGFGEGVAGLSSLGGLVIYYVILFLFRERISNKFVFAIKDEANSDGSQELISR